MPFSTHPPHYSTQAQHTIGLSSDPHYQNSIFPLHCFQDLWKGLLESLWVGLKEIQLTRYLTYIYLDMYEHDTDIAQSIKLVKMLIV